MNTNLLLDVDRYCLAAGIEKITADQYRRSIRCLSEFLDRPAVRADLSEDTINRWLEWIGTRRSPCTARNRKRGITPVWNWLAQIGCVPFYNPRALRKIRVDKTPPNAWSVEQVRQLLRATVDLPGTLKCGIPARDLMDAWVRVAYETGMRPGDLHRLKWHQLEGDCLSFVQHKTRGAHSVMLSEQAVRAVERLRTSESSTIFILTKGGMRRWEVLLFEAAKKHGFTRCRGQATGTLRKTAATETARVDGLQAASELLGHRSGTQVTRDHYVQPEALKPSKPPEALINALANPHHRNTGDRKHAS